MTFSFHEGKVVLASQMVHIQPVAYIYLQPVPWYLVAAPFLQFTLTAKCNGTIVWLSGRTQEPRRNYQVRRNQHFVPGLSTPCYLLRIVVQPPPPPLTPISFCCPWPPSHHWSNLTSLYPSAHKPLAIQYSYILSMCPNHLNTLWSNLLANSFIFQLSYIPLHS